MKTLAILFITVFNSPNFIRRSFTFGRPSDNRGSQRWRRRNSLGSTSSGIRPGDRSSRIRPSRPNAPESGPFAHSAIPAECPALNAPYSVAFIAGRSLFSITVLGRNKKRADHFCDQLFFVVPRTGIEPAHLSIHGPEPCASTNSATWAFSGIEFSTLEL
jgi:hypothetical protein